MRVLQLASVRFGCPPRMRIVGNGEVHEVPRRNLRFGPDLEPQAAQEMRALQEGNELARIIRETFDRMRRPLQFWEEP